MTESSKDDNRYIYHCNSIIDYLVSVKVADSLGELDKTRQCWDSGGGGGGGCGQVTRGSVTWSTGLLVISVPCTLQFSTTTSLDCRDKPGSHDTSSPPVWSTGPILEWNFQPDSRAVVPHTVQYLTSNKEAGKGSEGRRRKSYYNQLQNKTKHGQQIFHMNCWMKCSVLSLSSKLLYWTY